MKAMKNKIKFMSFIAILTISCREQVHFDISLIGEWNTDFKKYPKIRFEDSFMTVNVGDSVSMYGFERAGDSLYYCLGKNNYISLIEKQTDTSFIIYNFLNMHNIELTKKE